MGNRREFEKAIIVLEEYEEDKKLTKLLIDIIREYKRFLLSNERASVIFTLSGNYRLWTKEAESIWCQLSVGDI